MRYFTQEWIFGNLSEQASKAISEGYLRHLNELLADMKYPSRSLMAGIDFHDAVIFGCVREDNEVVVKAINGENRLGYFITEVRYWGVQDNSVLPTLKDQEVVEVLYDEYDFVDEAKSVVRYNFIISDKREYSILFGNLEFSIARSTGERYLSLRRMRA